MGWTIRVLGFNSQHKPGIFLFTTVSRTALRPTQPPIQWGSFPGGKAADHSHQSTAKVKECVERVKGKLYVYLFTWQKSTYPVPIVNGIKTFDAYLVTNHIVLFLFMYFPDMDCILSQMKHMQCPFMSHKHHSKVY
jgi:hypothetical protein